MNSLQKNKTKKLLKNALIELLQKKQFESIKLNEICEVGLVHKTTFYNHFQDKYELLNYLIKYFIDDIFKNINYQNDFTIYILNITRKVVMHIYDNKKIVKKILSNDQNNICRNITYNTFIQSLKQIVNSNEMNNIPINYILIFYVNAIFSVIIEWISSGMKDSEEIILDNIKKLITNDLK